MSTSKTDLCARCGLPQLDHWWMSPSATQVCSRFKPRQTLAGPTLEQLAAAQAEARELKTRLFHAERQRDVASGGLQAEARQSDEQRERACAAEREARELRQSRREAIDMANDNAVLAADALRERDELRAELARVREIVSGMREYADSCDHPSEASKRNAVEYWLTQLEDAPSQAAEPARREGS